MKNFLERQRAKREELLKRLRTRWDEQSPRKRRALLLVAGLGAATTLLTGYMLVANFGVWGLALIPVIVFFAKRRAWLLMQREDARARGELPPPKKPLLIRALGRLFGR
ncbi:hypothetical protein [Ramlibacter alkalitolerans]|uniref:Uncharacterized protein n=1 Tax=Ramlibacter alkalitolerans TaxID=2039631 RepID=A0ABS1JU59_9BURK|nr:hypothetical protein [Ramlibacter alkalitolerans]MBL0427794.1 hypothetical protein [Ramlibacter alkalitolerans]